MSHQHAICSIVWAFVWSVPLLSGSISSPAPPADASHKVGISNFQWEETWDNLLGALWNLSFEKIFWLSLMEWELGILATLSLYLYPKMEMKDSMNCPCYCEDRGRKRMQMARALPMLWPQLVDITLLFNGGKGKEGERGEKHRLVAFRMCPGQRLNPQSRPRPSLGIEPEAFWFMARCPTNGTTLARVILPFYFMIYNI